MDAYTFETLNSEHQTEVIRIFNHYVETSAAAYREKPVDDGFFGHFVADIEDYPGYAILDSGRAVVGFCLLEPLMPISTFSEVAEITYFIHKDHTGKGIGSAALKRLEQDAREMGVAKLIANISSDNIGSIVFHTRHGFQEYGRLRRAGKKFGKRFDIVYMEKEL